MPQQTHITGEPKKLAFTPANGNIVVFGIDENKCLSGEISHLSSQNQFGETPLIKALKDKKHGDLIKALFKASSPNNLVLADKTGNTFLHLLIQEPNLLLTHSSEEAKKEEIAQLIKLLLDHASLLPASLFFIKNNAHLTPLDLAIKANPSDATLSDFIKFLQSIPHTLSFNGENLVVHPNPKKPYLMVGEDHRTLTAEDIEKDTGNTPIIKAIELRKSAVMLRTLLEHTAEKEVLSHKNNRGYTCVHQFIQLAIDSEKDKLVLKDEVISLAKLVLNHHALPYDVFFKKNNQGESPQAMIKNALEKAPGADVLLAIKDVLEKRILVGDKNDPEKKQDKRLAPLIEKVYRLYHHRQIKAAKAIQELVATCTEIDYEKKETTDPSTYRASYQRAIEKVINDKEAMVEIRSQRGMKKSITWLLAMFCLPSTPLPNQPYRFFMPKTKTSQLIKQMEKETAADPIEPRV